MADAETQPGSPFWRFSLRFYRAPGIADACIALQDGCGVDVNVLLFLLWLAGARRQVAIAEARRVYDAVTPWRDAVVVPLRNLRRRLKNGVPPIEPDSGALFRTRIKAAELEAERLQQEALFAIGAELATMPAVSIAAAARANVAAYETVLAISLPPAPCEVLFAALAAAGAADVRTA